MEPDAKTDAIRALIAKWREAALTATKVASDYDARGDDAGNSFAFLKERRVWNTCADELDALLTAQPAEEQPPPLLEYMTNTVASTLEDIAQRLAQSAEGWQPNMPEGSLAFADVVRERVRQDAKWGEQNHDPFTYLTVLVEEVGELAQAALHTRFGGPAAVKLREEAVQTAAVAVAIVECIDRNKWRWPLPDPPKEADK